MREIAERVIAIGKPIRDARPRSTLEHRMRVPDPNKVHDDQPVWDYLETCTEDEVYEIKRLVYEGRDGDASGVRREDKTRMILTLTEKKYPFFLERALKGRKSGLRVEPDSEESESESESESDLD